MSGRPRVATSLTRTIFQVIPFSLGQSWPNFLFPLIDISFRMKGFQRCSTGWQTNSSPRVDSFNFVEFYENVIWGNFGGDLEYSLLLYSSLIQSVASICVWMNAFQKFLDSKIHYHNRSMGFYTIYLRFPFVDRPVNTNDPSQVQIFIAAALNFRSQVLFCQWCIFEFWTWI